MKHYSEFFQKIILVGAAAAIAAGIYVGFDFYKMAHNPSIETFGATKPAGLFTYRLSGAGISSSATSLTLTSLTLPQNGYPIQDLDVSDTFYLTIEPGNTARQEFLSCTTVGANTGGSVTISGCTRGLAPITPYTASTTLQFAHSGGSAVIFSDAPGLFNQYAAKDGTNDFTGIFSVSTTTDGDLSSPQTRMYMGGGSGTTTSAYLWLNRAAGTMGFRTAAQAELAFSTGGTTFTVVNPITSVSGELKLATSIYDFVLDGGNLRIASSTISAGTASGRRIDDYWNNRYNATTTHPGPLNIGGRATSTQFTVGSTNPSGNISSGDLWVGGDATTTSLSVTTLCFGNTCSAKQRVTTDVTISASAAETNAFSITLPANILRTDGAVCAKTFISDLDMNDTQTVQFAGYYGSTMIGSATTTNSSGVAINNQTGIVEFCIIASGATNSQEGSIYFAFDDAAYTTAATVNKEAIGAGVGSAAIDSTAAQTMKLTMTFSSAAGGITAANTVIDGIQP